MQQNQKLLEFNRLPKEFGFRFNYHSPFLEKENCLQRGRKLETPSRNLRKTIIKNNLNSIGVWKKIFYTTIRSIGKIYHHYQKIVHPIEIKLLLKLRKSIKK